MLRILLADDHPLCREGLKLLLEREGLAVVAEAADGGEAVRMALELLPDVSLLDFSMPVLTGIEATSQIRKSLPNARIILLSMHEEEALIVEALKAGASGYVFKTQTDKELVHTIQMVAKGALYLGPGISHSVIDVLAQNSAQPSAALNAHEWRIVELIADGRTSREIAVILELSPKTIESRRARIMQKLKLEETTQLVSYAVRTQLNKAAMPR